MSLHLVGGGRDQALSAEVYGPFLAEAEGAAVARAGSGAAPEVGVVVVHELDDLAAGQGDVTWFGDALTAAGRVRVRPLLVAEGSSLDPAQLAGLDGVLVAGGLTPAYAAALAPAAEAVRAMVGADRPYLGFSAGAAVAAGHALVGGYRWQGREVTAEDNGEEREELTVVDGLGLLDQAVDVHAAQWGTVTRLLAAVSAGLVTSGVAVDEGTVLVLGEGPPRVAGRGHAWWVEPAGAGTVRVRLQGASGEAWS